MRGARSKTAIIWIAATLLMLPAFASGHIVSDNSFLNVNWSQAFARELFSGHIYPRWLPQENEGAGSPVFYFYGPLPYYLTAPFELIFGPRFSVLLGMWLMLGLSGQAFYFLANNFVQPVSGVTSSIAYMAMPYHFLVDIWLRSDFGELAAYVFIPLCLLCAFRLGSKPVWTLGLASSFAGLLLSHLPSALLFAPLLASACIYVAWRENFAIVLVRASVAALLSLGLSAAYTMPAMLLQNLIHASNWDRYRPSDNLLFTKPVRFLFEIFLDAVAFEFAFVTAAFVVFLIAKGRWRLVVPWATFAAITVLLISPIAASFWDVLPAAFTKIQFPWRALIFLDVSCCMLFAITLNAQISSRGSITRSMLYGIVASIGLFLVERSLDTSYTFIARPLSIDDRLIATHVNPIEYLPSCRPFLTWNQLDRTPTEIAMLLMARASSPELPVYYFPFLAVYLDGKRISEKCDPRTGFIALSAKTNRVRIEQHSLAQERGGYAVTVLSAVLLLLGMVVSQKAHLALLLGQFLVVMRRSLKIGGMQI